MRTFGQKSADLSIESDGERPRRSRVAVLVGSACIIALLLLAIGFGQSRAHDADVHALTVHLVLTDTLGETDRLCLALFAGETGELSNPVQGQCLATGSDTVTFDGLPHGYYRVVVPGPASTVPLDRFEGQIVLTEIPDGTEATEFAVEIVLAPPSVADGAITVAAFVCPPAIDPAADAIALQVSCLESDEPAEFIMAPIGADGVLADTEAVIAPAIDAEPAVFGGLVAGDYQLAGVIDDPEQQLIAWFVLPEADGEAQALPVGPTVDITLAENQTINLAAYLVGRQSPDPTPTPVTSDPTAPAGVVAGVSEAIMAPAPVGASVAPGTAAVITLPNTGTGSVDSRWERWDHAVLVRAISLLGVGVVVRRTHRPVSPL